ncbi:MAG TPA: acetylglutamate kinase [Clostridia bacterium]|nr:acetylglutamate kinase [Clostridia bacterium]
MRSVYYNKNDGCSVKQIQMMNELRKLWEQHGLWTRSFIISTAAGLGDLNFVTQRLLRNPTDFAQLLQPYYGREKASRFEELLRGHLLIAAEFVNNAKAGKTAEASAARARWYQNAEEIAAVLASINSYWNENEWRNMLFDHLRLVENEATLRLRGQFEEDIRLYDQIQEQALEMADVMSQGIIKQFMIR